MSKVSKDPNYNLKSAYDVTISEQEELIQKLKEESEAHNAQYLTVLQLLIGLSSLLYALHLLSLQRISSVVLAVK